MYKIVFEWAAKIISIYSFAFWIIFVSTSGGGNHEWSIFPILMVVGSGLAFWMTKKRKNIALFVVAFFLFFPMGYYFLGGNSALHASIGLSYIVLMVLAIILHMSKPSKVK